MHVCFISGGMILKLGLLRSIAKKFNGVTTKHGL